MAVTYDSYEAKVVQAVIEMLAASATFRTITGTVSSATAKAFIVESWGGPPKLAGRGATTVQAIACDNSTLTLTPPWAEVHVSDLPSQSIGVGVWEHNGQAIVNLVLPRRITTETPPESFRRARNQADGVRADLEAAFGTTVNAVAALARGSVEVAGPSLPDDAGAEGDCFEARLTISFEG